VRNYTALDIPCGCGGAALGLKQAGFEIILAIDIDPIAAKTYEHNGLGEVIIGDIDKFGKEIFQLTPDICWFSFPCQPFSIINAGKDKKDDWRTTYLYNVLQILSFVNPQLFIFENVPYITKFKDYKKLKLLLSQRGFILKEKILNAANYGTPQKRKRLFLVGTKPGLQFVFPVATHSIIEGQKTLTGQKIEQWTKVKDILEDSPDTQVIIKCKDFSKRNGPTEYSINEPLLTLTTQNHFEVHYLSENDREGLLKRLDRNQKNNVGFGCYPINLEEPADTLTARYGNLGTDQLIFYSKEKIRKLSIRECARIQGFPDSFEFPFGTITDKYRLIGNAVPVNVAFALAKSAIACLNNSEEVRQT